MEANSVDMGLHCRGVRIKLTELRFNDPVNTIDIIAVMSSCFPREREKEGEDTYLDRWEETLAASTASPCPAKAKSYQPTPPRTYM